MKKRFWSAVIEIYKDGTVKAATLWSREAVCQPADVCRSEPGRDVFIIWFETEDAAADAVFEALCMDATEGLLCIA